jgi:hypothetical protein
VIVDLRHAATALLVLETDVVVVLEMEVVVVLGTEVVIALGFDSSAVEDGLGSPVGCSPGAGSPVAVGAPSGPMVKGGKPGGGGIKAPGAAAARGMTRMPAAAISHPGQNLSFRSILSNNDQYCAYQMGSTVEEGWSLN